MFAVDIDNFVEEIFDAIEQRQDGVFSHQAMYKGKTKEEASKRFFELMKSFIEEEMYECDGWSTIITYKSQRRC